MIIGNDSQTDVKDGAENGEYKVEKEALKKSVDDEMNSWEFSFLQYWRKILIDRTRISARRV